MVLPRHLLRAEVLLDGQREVRAALDRGVVCDDDALATLDDADPRHDAGTRCVAVVQLPRGERVQLEEGAPWIDEAVDALAREQLPAGAVALDGAFAAAPGDERCPLPQLGDELLHSRLSPRELVRSLDVRLQERHVRSLERGPARAEAQRDVFTPTAAETGSGDGTHAPRRGCDVARDAGRRRGVD